MNVLVAPADRLFPPPCSSSCLFLVLCSLPRCGLPTSSIGRIILIATRPWVTSSFAIIISFDSSNMSTIVFTYETVKPSNPIPQLRSTCRQEAFFSIDPRARTMSTNRVKTGPRTRFPEVLSVAIGALSSAQAVANQPVRRELVFVRLKNSCAPQKLSACTNYSPLIPLSSATSPPVGLQTPQNRPVLPSSRLPSLRPAPSISQNQVGYSPAQKLSHAIGKFVKLIDT